MPLREEFRELGHRLESWLVPRGMRRIVQHEPWSCTRWSDTQAYRYIWHCTVVLNPRVAASNGGAAQIISAELP